MEHPRLAYLIILSLLFSGCSALPLRPLEHSGLLDLVTLANVTTSEQCAPRRFTESSLSVPAPESPTPVTPRRISLLTPLQAIESRIPGVVDEKFGLFMRHLETAPLQHIDLAPHIHALKQLPRMVRALHSTLLTTEQLVAHQSRFEHLFLVYSRAYFGAVNVTSTMMEGAHGLEARLQAETRFTDVHVFPGLSATVWLSSDRQVRSRADAVDSKQITSDLTRIFLEAYFDASFMVPAAPTATALTAPFENGQTQESAAYPTLDGAHLRPQDVVNLTHAALRAEAVATSAMGEAIRGGAITSLNNETLAAGVETAAGVIAKKLVEREFFCYLSSKMK
jgi:hypothetical protein